MEAPLLGEPLPVELMNTIWADREGVHDALAEPEPGGVAAWLAAVEDRLAPYGVGAVPDVPRRLADEFRDLRDALRRLAAAATQDRRPVVTQDRRPVATAITEVHEAVAVLNRACARAPVWSQLVWADPDPVRVTRSAQAPGEVALSVVAEQAVWLFGGADRPAIRACPGPACVLYFVRDHPRREWCSAACGNRARVARYYQRHKEPTPN